jgi:hypothetical protein
VHRSLQRLVVPQREEGDANGGVAHLHTLDGDAGRGIPGVLRVADDDAGLHVRGRDAVQDHLGAAEVDVVVCREHGDARPLEADLHVVGGFRAGVPDAEHHGAARGDDQPRGSGLHGRHVFAADRTRDAHAIGAVRDHRVRAGRRRIVVDDRAHAVLLERDLRRCQHAARRVQDDFHGRRGPDELPGFRDLDRWAREPSGNQIDPAEHDQQEHDEGEELAHRSDDSTNDAMTFSECV